jgi:hypothetical protein
MSEFISFDAEVIEKRKYVNCEEMLQLCDTFLRNVGTSVSPRKVNKSKFWFQSYDFLPGCHYINGLLICSYGFILLMMAFHFVILCSVE